MVTKDALPSGLLEATRLTRAGRLVEATALIQRYLRQEPICEAPVEHSVSGRVIDAAFSTLQEPIQTPPRGKTGNFIAGSFANPAGTRPYKLYIPTSCYSGKALPLIVMLHGCTQTPDDFAAGTRMNALAEERGCFVLYPAQTQGANRSRCWNWFKRGDQRRDKGEPAIIAGMTREIMGRYEIDARKVYVAGLSAGAAMAAVMAAAYPDLYAAVGMHSGLAVGSAHDVPSAFAVMRGTPQSSPRGAGSGPRRQAIPLIVFHGDRDSTVHPQNSERVILESSDGNAVPSHNVSVERGQVPGGHAYTRTLHFDPTGRVMLEHWLVHGAGHAWSGGSTRGSYTDPKGPDAARAMIRFFYEQERLRGGP
jgi:poly(hydroxyalkanoate) depolymerase family esterase